MMNFEYTGEVQQLTLPKGKYILECWGAQGGYRSDAEKGGKGGYSIGTLTLDKATYIFVYVGGQSTATDGGFNGGGKRSTYNGGGGASDIRIGQDSLYARVIVAGGGGSDGASSKAGGAGGGTSGISATDGYGSGGGGGTQTAGGTGGSGNDGTFGQGGEGLYRKSGYGGAGGGGWYGGGGTYPDSSSDDDKGGGGGSGFVWTGENAPSSYLLDATYYLTDAQTIDGTQSFTAPTGGTETGHAGNGYVRITPSQPNPPANLTESHDYFGANLSWTAEGEITGYRIYLNESLIATTPSTSYQLLGLNADTEYKVSVIAYNTSGNSDPAEITFTTPSADFKQTAREYQTITLAWTKSSRASGYRLYRDGSLIATVSGNTYTDTGLFPSETHQYVLKAYSGAKEGVSGSLAGKTEEGFYEQKVVFQEIKIVDNPTTINKKITLTVTAEDKLVIYEPEKFFSGEIYSGEL